MGMTVAAYRLGWMPGDCPASRLEGRVPPWHTAVTRAIIVSIPRVPLPGSFEAPGPLCQNTVRDKPSNAVEPRRTTTTEASPDRAGVLMALARGLRNPVRPSLRRAQGDSRAMSDEYASKPSPAANHSSPNHRAHPSWTTA